MLSSAGITHHAVFGDRRAALKPAGISSPQMNLTDSNQKCLRGASASLFYGNLAQQRRPLL